MTDNPFVREIANALCVAASNGYTPAETAEAAVAEAKRFMRVQAEQELYGEASDAAWTVTHRGKVRTTVLMREQPDRSHMPDSLRECVRDAEEALNSGALIAGKLGNEDVRAALVSTRSHLRRGLGEPEE